MPSRKASSPALLVLAWLITGSLGALDQSTINPHASSFKNIAVSLTHSSTSTSAPKSTSTSTSTSTTSPTTVTTLSSTSLTTTRHRTRSTTTRAASMRSLSNETVTILPQLFKAGICPVSTSTFGDCTVSCVSDASCRGTRKCCLINGCGLKCLQPINQSSAANPEVRVLGQDLLNPDGTARKAFNSPVRLKLTSRADPSPTVAAYQNAGTCPKVTPNPFAGRCVRDECSPSNGDSECQGSKKCCMSQDGTCMLCTDVTASTEATSPVSRISLEKIES